MLSIERVKELMGDPKLSDEEAAEIRDSCRAIAEIMFEQWQHERGKKESAQPLDMGKIIWYSNHVDPISKKASVFCLFRYPKTGGYANEANLRERGIGSTIVVRFILLKL